MFGKIANVTVVLVVLDFEFGEFFELSQVVAVALLQQGIAQHRHQGRRHAHGHFKVNAVALETLKNLQQRNVGFRDGFVEPFFF